MKLNLHSEAKKGSVIMQFRLQGREKYNKSYVNLNTKIPEAMKKKRQISEDRVIYSIRDAIMMKRVITFSTGDGFGICAPTEQYLQDIYIPYFLIENHQLYRPIYDIYKERLNQLQNDQVRSIIDLDDTYKNEFFQLVNQLLIKANNVEPVDHFLTEDGYFDIKNYFEDDQSGFPDLPAPL